MEITQVPGSCPQCLADYDELLEQYGAFISYIVREIHAKKSDSKEVKVLNDQQKIILYISHISFSKNNLNTFYVIQ